MTEEEKNSDSRPDGQDQSALNDPANEFVTVARTDEIPDGEGRAFEVNETVIAIFNNGGTFQAIDDMCPHMGASLATGFYDGKTVTCPWHAWRFDTTSGAWCDNRRLKIPVYEVRVTADGEVQVSTTPKTVANDIEQRAGQKSSNQQSSKQKNSRQAGSGQMDEVQTDAPAREESSGDN